MAMTKQEEYIYCIWLPFQCTSQGPSYWDSVVRRLPPPPPESFVAKVGITKNPAKRLCDIYTAFQEFGEPRVQPLLSTLSPSDDPQTAVMKAKSIDDVIFIEKVHNPGNAEKDIRTNIIVKTTVIHLGQPELTEEFRELFRAKVPQVKKYYLETVGITEWIIISNQLAKNLQKRFREGGIWQQHQIPSGEELASTLSAFCRQYSLGKAPSRDRIILGRAGKRLPLLIEFKALEFSHTLYCMLLMVQKPEEQEY